MIIYWSDGNIWSLIILMWSSDLVAVICCHYGPASWHGTRDTRTSGRGAAQLKHLDWAPLANAAWVWSVSRIWALNSPDSHIVRTAAAAGIFGPATLHPEFESRKNCENVIGIATRGHSMEIDLLDGEGTKERQNIQDQDISYEMWVLNNAPLGEGEDGTTIHCADIAARVPDTWDTWPSAGKHVCCRAACLSWCHVCSHSNCQWLFPGLTSWLAWFCH